MDKDVADRLAAYVKEKWTSGCPMCSSTVWNLNGQLYGLPTQSHPQVPTRRDGVFLLAVFTCDNCGNTVMVDAVKIGVLDAEETAKISQGWKSGK